MWIKLFFLLISILVAGYSDASVVFSSKWASATSGGTNTEDDGGNWYLAQECTPGSNFALMSRVSGDRSAVGNGGPAALPASISGDSTYYLELNVKTSESGSQPCLYLQDVSENSATEYTDLYMGAWWYFEDGFTFRESIKFMDFRGNMSKLEFGTGHLALFGFTHNSYYVGNTNTGTDWPGNYLAWWGAEGGVDHNLTAFRYASGSGTNVSGNEYTGNYYNLSPWFDSNLNTSETVVGRSGYNPASVNRIHFAGGKWMAVIVHAKISSTVGEYDAWIKDGASDLKKVMQWNKDTVWATDDSTPHDFYTINGTAGINHVQFLGYMNAGENYPPSQYIWLANPVVATTLNEVKTYLGLGEGEADVTAPTVTISTSDPSAISSDTLTVTGTASDAVGVTSCKYRLGSAPDAGNGTACTGTTEWSCSTSGYSSGANTLYVGCTDAAANWGAGDSITVNYTPPLGTVRGLSIQ